MMYIYYLMHLYDTCNRFNVSDDCDFISIKNLYVYNILNYLFMAI